MPRNTVYAITGANRGLGLGLDRVIPGPPITTIIATVRSDEAASSFKPEIYSITAANRTAFYILKLDFSSAIPPDNILEAFNTAADAGTVSHVDIIICNAGSSSSMTPQRCHQGRGSPCGFRDQYHRPAAGIPGLLASAPEIALSPYSVR
ncbi:hypothetical protein F5X99DRAFT_430798 [Biscogniauxia marginata]|nr:hypothetical protein F5X99DRAFT_430798 [Biscogniauxia marginata]